MLEEEEEKEEEEEEEEEDSIKEEEVVDDDGDQVMHHGTTATTTLDTSIVSCVCDNNSYDQLHTHGLVCCVECGVRSHLECMGGERNFLNGGKKCLHCLSSSTKKLACGATLIVCPMAILGQWESELRKHSRPGSLKLLVYTGIKKLTEMVRTKEEWIRKRKRKLKKRRKPRPWILKLKKLKSHPRRSRLLLKRLLRRLKKNMRLFKSNKGNPLKSEGKQLVKELINARRAR